MEQAQLQQLVQLLGAKMLPKQTAVVDCPKTMVGRVIGKGGETIKALQQYTGAMIQIDQSTDPTRVTIAGSPQSLQLAVSMVNDIVRGTFKGFAMLRQIAIGTQGPIAPFGQPQPVYVQGYGFVPPSQVYNPEDALSASLMRNSPTGTLTPPLPGAIQPGTQTGNITPDSLAALLAQSSAPMSGGMHGGLSAFGRGQAQSGGPGVSGNDALIAQLLNQLASQGMPASQVPVQAPVQHGTPAGLDLSNLDPSTLQTILAQNSMLGGNSMQQQTPGSGLSSPLQGVQPSSLSMANQGGISASPSTSPYSSGTHPGLLSMMMAGGAQGLGSRPISSAGSVGSPPGNGTIMPPMSSALPGGNTLTGLLQGTNTASSFLGTSPSSTSSPASGSGRGTPVKPSTSAAPNQALSVKSYSGESSPLGQFGAIGSTISAEDALAIKMKALSTGDVMPAAD